MNTSDLKKFAFTIQAVKSKGYEISELLEKSDDEIRALPLSNTIILALLSMKASNIPVEFEEVKQVLNDNTRSPEEVPTGVIKAVEEKYTPEVQEADLNDIVSSTEVAEEVKTEIPETEKVEEITRTVYSPEDLKTVRDALQQKELRTAAAYLKHLKTAVPDSILKTFDGSTLTDLCNERVKEIKTK